MYWFVLQIRVVESWCTVFFGGYAFEVVDMLKLEFHCGECCVDVRFSCVVKPTIQVAR